MLTLHHCGVFVVHPMSAMTLPISLADLSPHTRDWLLAKSAALKVPPIQALNDVLESVAAKELGAAFPAAASSPSTKEGGDQ